ncbi:hypothetical protein EDB86DRAFT_564540 [Lactarius hatsudake]|nr:hypothetical protein EDB86DRAFT_990244 [Lactarius hatsudake]KAH8980379.1 hypothetical protein EDB86DRAFT_564540 [Lactarius hatsudake]
MPYSTVTALTWFLRSEGANGHVPQEDNFRIQLQYCIVCQARDPGRFLVHLPLTQLFPGFLWVSYFPRTANWQQHSPLKCKCTSAGMKFSRKHALPELTLTLPVSMSFNTLLVLARRQLTYLSPFTLMSPTSVPLSLEHCISLFIIAEISAVSASAVAFVLAPIAVCSFQSLVSDGRHVLTCFSPNNADAAWSASVWAQATNGDPKPLSNSFFSTGYRSR